MKALPPINTLWPLVRSACMCCTLLRLWQGQLHQKEENVIDADKEKMDALRYNRVSTAHR